MRLRGLRLSRNVEDRHPVGNDGLPVIGGVGLPVVPAIGCDTEETGQSDTYSVNRL